MGQPWTTADMPDQRGRVAVITGANSGLGLATAAALAAKGAHVVMAIRNLDKGKQAAAEITTLTPRADIALQRLDLSSLDSIHTAATDLRAAYERIDLLINNAGVMMTPRQTTADGFELQFGTNHLGHFALTGLLLNQMLAVDGSRIVSISSPMHKIWASIHFDDLQWERRYNRVAAYSQSKLANLLFAYQLHHRLAAARAKTIAVAAHPGGCYSQQVHDSPQPMRPLVRLIGPRLLQPPHMSAPSPLRAATALHVCGGEYYGPNGRGEVRGHPVLVDSSALSRDETVQRRLWQVSEKLTGVRYPL
jgi:NAD(P)-dependent dehydrogenase (short-subunit alcohol dehydrogenase family)